MIDAENAPAFLRRIYEAGLAAVDPAQIVGPALPERPRGRCVVVGAGKAAGSMARAVEQAWDGPLEGLVVTRYGHAAPTERIEVVEASHPVPDAAGREAAQRMLDLARSLGPDDLLLCLISGGGSALLALPAEGLTLEDKQAVNRALLASGAAIGEMNCLRKHLSAIKGGRLAAAAAPARVVTLAISDVPGDGPEVIASGPTVPDPTSFADARAVLEKYGIEPPPSVARHLAEEKEETPKPGDPRLANSDFRLIARPQDMLEAAAAAAWEAGIAPLIFGDAIEGEARDVAKVFAGIARQVRLHRQPAPPPCLLLSGGETTVTLSGKGRGQGRGQGRGGRNSEFQLSLALALEGLPGIYALACDTDGIDGSEDNAGAFVTPDSLARAEAKGLSAKQALAGNDAYSLFAALDDLLVTGPTLTNVNDFRAILVL
ncbi:glycerate kinase type-2 family protein [Aquibaculum sediminis]|uniref:glycerate kinase type-2 family protein n=1 Tax=Aquibaculum sediminis TaxID=3231907 RepID=UPI00345607DD